MPALNFKVFVDKVESGEKSQSIRPPRKYPIKRGSKLYLYTGMRTKNCRKLGEAICSKIIPIIFNYIDIFKDGTELSFYVGHSRKTSNPWSLDWQLQLMKDDGFDIWKDFKNFFIKAYRMKLGDSLKMDIIKWKDFKYD